MWNDTSVIPLSEDLLLFCILCAKNLGSSKWALNTIPRMSDTDRDMIPSFCIIVCYLTIMQVYILIFINRIIVEKIQNCYNYNIPIYRVINTCICFDDTVQVCSLCCLLCLFVCFVLFMFKTNMSFSLSITKLLKFNKDPQFCFHEHFKYSFSSYFLKREQRRLKW